jgi:hypothetical protein
VAAAFALAASLMVVTQFAIIEYREQQRAEVLLAEQRQLEAELEAVKKLAVQPEPVVVLENDDGTRVIMDLDSAAQAVSMTTYD